MSSGAQRTKVVKLNVLYGFAIKGCSILLSLLLVPLTIGYINSELYGIWLTLSSVIHWISFFDIGFGNGLRNKLAIAIANGDKKKARIYVSTTYAIMIAIFLPLALLSFFFVPLIDWSGFLNVPAQYNKTLILSAQIVVVALSLQIILKLLQNVLFAYQYSALASFLELLGSALSLCFIFLLTKTVYPNLTIVALVFSFSPVIVLLIGNLYFYSTKFKDVSPHYKYINISSAKDLFNLGWEFFVLQVAFLILFQMVNILISRVSGPEQVTNYNVAYKYLSVSVMIMNIILNPIWSAFTEAYTKKDSTWMKIIYNRLIKLFGLSVLFTILCILISPLVYNFWLGDKVSVPYSLTVLVGIYLCIKVWGNIHAVIINGTGKIRIQLIFSVGEMILFLPFALLLGSYFGLYGILWAMILIDIPATLICWYQVSLLLNYNAKGIFNK